MEPGLYVTFFTKDEPASRALPPVGPLDNVVLRQHVLLAERRSVQQAQELGVAIDRWLEAELEIQRAMGAEPGGAKRSERRFSARDGVFVRFAVFGNLKERDLVPELGPYAVVVVGPTSIEADGTTLATRAASDLAAWELVGGAGDETIGAHKPDVALRTSNTAYHPSISVTPPTPGRAQMLSATATSAPPTVPSSAPPHPPFEDRQRVEVAPPFELPPLRGRAPELEPTAPPRPRGDPALVSPPTFIDRPPKPVAVSSVNSAPIEQLDRERRDETLRSRTQVEERKPLGVGDQNTNASTFAMRYRADATEEETSEEADSGRKWGPAIWRLRFAIIGALFVLAGLYTFVTARGGFGFGPSAAQFRYAAVTQRVTGAHWEYTVNAVQSSPQSGSVTAANGTFYIVRLAVTNTAGEGQQLSPSSFTLLDANGGRHGAEGTNSGVYAPGSGLIWPAAFPARQVVSAPIVFDIDPSLPRGMLLSIDELPDLRIRLD